MTAPDHANPSVSNADPNTNTGVGPDATPTFVPPTVTERYSLGDEIARGGMGVVYRATDTTLGRDVAVKVLQEKYGPASGVALRFADEARISGQLQHPSIPPVHDLGTLPDGRPFLAMKLIKGQTLEALLKARPDPSAERGRFVAVFEQICQALAYAHAHKVIHRDLKPSNVMVGAFAEVQVMDWGLAKVLGAHLAEGDDPEATASATRVDSLRDAEGTFTQAGSVLGTPAFMPPEQALGAVTRVDARSDVFGLGAILAVILTGQPPFAASSAETLRILAAQGKLDECFARLDACGADPEYVALCKHCLAPMLADRPADAGAVARAVAELRAAAEERARRAELERVRVEGEKAAVEARALERRKRRQLWIGAAAALALALIGGLTAVMVVQQRANASLAEEQAKVQARNRELAEEQAKVQARFEMAQKAIATFHTGVSEDMLLKNDQFKELRTKLLKEAAGFYADLEKLLAGQTDARSRQTLAAGYFQLGDLTEKIGSRLEALAVHRQALAVRRELAALPGADVETRLDVARSLLAVGSLLRVTGDNIGALAAFTEARNLAERLAALEPTNAVRSVLAQSHFRIGNMVSATGKWEEGMEACGKGLAILQRLADANPAITAFQSDLAQSHVSMGHSLLVQGKSTEALESYRKALAIRQKLSVANPAVTKFQFYLAESHITVGNVMGTMGKPAEALEAYGMGLAIAQKLADANPAVIEFQRALAISHHNSGILLSATGKPAEALEAYGMALAIGQKLADANPAVPNFQSSLSWNHNAIGELLSETGKPVEALEAHRKALAIDQKLVDANPADTKFQRGLARSHTNVGVVLSQMGKSAEALEAYGMALAIAQELVEAEPTVLRYQYLLARSHDNIGRLHARQKRFAEAFTALDAGLAILQKLAEVDPKNIDGKSRLAQSHASRGWARVRAGQPAEAAADLRRAIDLWAQDPALTIEQRFERSQALALLAGLGGNAKSGVTKTEAAAFADQAVAALKDANQAGWARVDELKEQDFDALRGREDFKRLQAILEAEVGRNAKR